jgi:hypothetical protein
MIKFPRRMTIEARLRGRPMAVVFTTPYECRVYENGVNVTRSFPFPKWNDWIAEVNQGLVSETIHR